MKMLSLMTAAVFVPAAAVAQIAPPVTSVTKARLDAMESNVAGIVASAERDRWNANVSMWKVVFAKSGKLQPSDVQSLQNSLQAIRTNVARLAPSPEKERWQSNIRLWRTFLLGSSAHAAEMPCEGQPQMPMAGMSGGMSMPMSMPMSGVRLATDAAFGRMRLTVSRISEALERDRWSANTDLWEAVFGADAP
jgi:hypothetical protein